MYEEAHKNQMRIKVGKRIDDLIIEFSNDRNEAEQCILKVE